jgi:peptidoglycan hydrolase-like protein with peptidoglycan-binding domain
MASASQTRTAVGVTDEIKQTPGTQETEAVLNLDRQGRVDLQLRLNALGFKTGGTDGSLGPRSREAIGAWQRQSGIVETTYLTPQQHLFLVSQTDPMMAAVRAQQDKAKAATPKRQQVKKVVKATPKATRKNQQVAGKNTRTKVQTADDDIPYKPRNTTRTRVDDDDSSGVGSFAAGALLGTAIGVAVGKH